ncbi:hypothetical protein QBC40DRAFT_332216 [Triangularia verruculosa]|uniref:Uncharacterized protein n=1 Tax=Triangularia verruculosa TaxID=2587418 RepID=A0AAN7ATF9_9PEZI|nr:hypothetical protein QBC40DRAFT_332216 [Triangularia verruculosa]
MALLLAPYNEAMRIGMGFNSYTQQLCVNDIVRKPGGSRASENDLRQANPGEGLPKPTADERPKSFTESSGTVAIKRHSDGGQADVSQIVTWKGGFTDQLSDIAKSLNISGALTVKCAAIQGGASAKLDFLDASTFLQSQANYSINVTVTNQKLVADDVTEFTPIPNLPASKFNEVYGDCFISGFIEGGVLQAVISKTVSDKSDIFNLGGKISIEGKFAGGAVEVEGKAKGGKNETEKNTATKTTISVTWSGGGDIKPDDVAQWDVPAITRVAMEFPDRVAVCPQRTFAILTKYTTLRSFYEQTVKGSPLDYEIAGIYTSALLDSYMAYKVMWEDLHNTIKELDRGAVGGLKRRPTDEKLLTYAQRASEDYNKRMENFNKYKAAVQKSGSYQQQEDLVLAEPLPPTKVEPYAADAFGLDEAARDCRFEMIKIVREVNEVTDNPKVATDPTRNWRYLSPHVFRLLLPSDKEPMPTPEEIAKCKEDLQVKIRECTEKEEEIKEAKRAKAEALRERDELKDGNASTQKSADESDTKSKELASKLSDAEAKLSEAEARLAQLQQGLEEQTAAATANSQRVAQLEAKVAETEREASAIEERYSNGMRELHEEVKNHAAAAESYLRQVDHLSQKLNSGSEVELLNVSYGGRQFLGDGGVEERVKSCIRDRRQLTVSNDFFGCDPRPGDRKYAYFAYQRRGERAVMVTGWEYDNVSFP